MAQLPTDRTTSNSDAEHVNDHNTLHGQHNDLDGHAAATAGAHPATAVSFSPSGLIVATDVQAALAELDAEKATVDHAHPGTYVPAEIAGGTIVHTVPYPVQWINGALQTADTTLHMRCLSRGTINAIRIWVGTSSGNISVAVYRADGTNGAPGTRVATSGAIASPASGTRDIALDSSVTVEVGDWLSLSADNVTVTFAITTTSSATSLFEGLAYRDLVHPAPATSTPSVTGLRTPVLVGVNV